jgi:hypothetical protein
MRTAANRETEALVTLAGASFFSSSGGAQDEKISRNKINPIELDDVKKVPEREPFLLLAERVGFEPTIESPLCRISSAVLSTTQPPLREGQSSGAARNKCPDLASLNLESASKVV